MRGTGNDPRLGAALPRSWPAQGTWAAWRPPLPGRAGPAITSPGRAHAQQQTGDASAPRAQNWPGQGPGGGGGGRMCDLTRARAPPPPPPPPSPVNPALTARKAAAAVASSKVTKPKPRPSMTTASARAPQGAAYARRPGVDAVGGRPPMKILLVGGWGGGAGGRSCVGGVGRGARGWGKSIEPESTSGRERARRGRPRRARPLPLSLLLPYLILLQPARLGRLRRVRRIPARRVAAIHLRLGGGSGRGQTGRGRRCRRMVLLRARVCRFHGRRGGWGRGLLGHASRGGVVGHGGERGVGAGNARGGCDRTRRGTLEKGTSEWRAALRRDGWGGATLLLLCTVLFLLRPAHATPACGRHARARRD